MESALPAGFQILTADFDIAADGGSDTFELKGLSDDYNVVGGSAQVADAAGWLDLVTVRRDSFLCEIKADSKNGISNQAVEIGALNDILQNFKMRPTQLPKDSTTLFSVTHENVGAGILTAPYKVRINLYVVPR